MTELNNEPAMYEPTFFKIIVQHVRQGWKVADIGACQGDLTIPMATLVGPEGHVYAFDLHPDNLEAIKEKLNLAEMTRRVTLVNAAVGDEVATEVTVYRGRNNSEYEWNLIGKDVDGHLTEAAFTLNCVSLDQYFRENVRLNLIKIDVEGSAAAVIKGMHKIIERDRPILLFENHNLEEWKALRDLAYTFNYEIWDPVNDTQIDLEQQPAYHMIVLPIE